MAKKRFRKIRRKTENRIIATSEPEIMQKVRQKHKNPFLEFYDVNYKKLLIIPFLLLILALGQIAYQTATTGSFITKGVSLKGGTTITIPTKDAIDSDALLLELTGLGQDVEIRVLKAAGIQTAIAVETDATDQAQVNDIIKIISEKTGFKSDDLSVDTIGSSLGASFFKEIMLALLVAFIFMGIVVYLYFRTIIPSAAVILAAFSDMAVTVAVVNVVGMKVSTAGIAAFLMLIGYSIDTDILLSTKLIKRKHGTIFNRVIESAKTGLTMNFTTLAALLVIIIFSKSEILTQIMTILLIGLLVDLINTWIQNVGILRLYLEKNEN